MFQDTQHSLTWIKYNGLNIAMAHTLISSWVCECDGILPCDTNASRVSWLILAYGSFFSMQRIEIVSTSMLNR